MAKPERKKVTIQYRKFADPTGGFAGTDLRTALSSAMQSPITAGGGLPRGERVDARILALGSYGTLVLNHFEAKDEFFFGEIVRFEPGADLPLLKMGGEKEYNLSQSKAPAGHEPLRGVLYFMVFQNHVMLLESDCASGRAEKYLSWLLAESGVVADDAQVILETELQTADGENQLSSVDQVVIKPKPVEPDPQSGGMIDEFATAMRDRAVSFGRAIDVLKAAGLAETDINAITEHDTRIEVTVQVRFKTRRKRRALVMADAKRLLRNVNDEDMTLSGTGGRQKNGKIVKLAHGANVLLVGSLFDLKDTARALAEAYQYFIGNGYIEE